LQKIARKIAKIHFFFGHPVLPRVKMAKKSKFLGFFRNHARNVLHIEIHLPERNFGRKKLSWAF
jgi:hypothetical protein